ncbi:MAG: TonB-dependent receptor plug domain-containing protein, partial [Bacteroidia bacterium]|nr:TonB-dependent receptor plug domain-containing protein [Bacteroidia bacterium]
MLKTALFLVITFVACIRLQAQKDSCRITISGIVYDSATKKPLQFSRVAIEGTTKSASTNAKGLFVLTGVCAGVLEFHFSHENEDRHYDINIFRDTQLKVYLPDIHIIEIDSVTVTSSAKISVGSIKLTHQQIELGKGGSITDLMSGIKEIAQLKTGSSVSKPVVNGLQGNRVVILNNGVRQEGQQWGAEHAPEIDAFLATEVTLVKGPDALQYGSDGIGGTILVNPASIFGYAPGKLKGEINVVGASNGRMGASSM